MKIDVWSDIACPFCYIGKRHLEQALAKTNLKDEVEVIWHSYLLDSGFEYTEGQTLTQVLAEKKLVSRLRPTNE